MSATGTAQAPDVQLLEPRDVPLGGQRAMTVRRTLPARQRSFVGAWCFADHYGPDDVAETGGMDVAPHPHTGLATVSWLFEGEIEHRDSAGVVACVRPGEMNLMTAGAGICHSEVSTAETTALHGVQLWVVLPEHAADAPRDFQHHRPSPTHPAGPEGGVELRVMVGELAGQSSPVTFPTPLLGAEVRLAPGTTWRAPVDPAYEHGVLLDVGSVTVEGVDVGRGALAVLDTGRDALTLVAGEGGARLMLLGGEPFTEEIVLWWNFVGRSHDEVVAFREAWQAEGDRFGAVEGYVGGEDTPQRIPAPELPGVRLKARGRLGRGF
ncbi:pirin family protein [Nocardioidaceae bacterium]|nr:pirin family protein [Nocardioidaceae bacterium]